MDRLNELVKKLNLNDFSEIISESSNTRFSGDSLIWLDLGCKDISSLPEDIFDPFTELEYIGLYGNQLEELPENIFQNLHRLRILDLGENSLKTLPENLFKNNNALEYLWIYSNNITYLPDDIFSSLTKLRELNINSNQLKAFPVEFIKNLKELRVLELALNKFDKLDPRILRQAPYLDKLVFNTYINGNLHITNHVHKDEEIIIEGNRKDDFVLVTGIMGSGKSTLMKHYSGTRINPNFPKVGKNILYDNIFGVSVADNRVANFFEIDGPTVTSWTKFIKISKITVIVINTLMSEGINNIEKIDKLLKHVKKHKARGSKIMVIMNNFIEADPIHWMVKNGIDFNYADLEFFIIPPGETVPDIGGLQRIILDTSLVNEVFIQIARSLA